MENYKKGDLVYLPEDEDGAKATIYVIKRIWDIPECPDRIELGELYYCKCTIKTPALHDCPSKDDHFLVDWFQIIKK